MVARRALALVTGLWLVVCGVLGTRHEARAAHFVDGQGRAFHASRMTGEHTTSQSDVHGRDSAPDHDACGIVATAHQPVISDHAGVVTRGRAAEPHRNAPPPALELTPFCGLRIAPKTSPPTIA